MNEKASCITINCGCCGNGDGGFPGEEYIDITTPYTAESDGYVYAGAKSKISDGGVSYVSIGSSNGMYDRSMTSFSGLGIHAHLPVKKGAVIEIELVRADLVSARFYPAS